MSDTAETANIKPGTRGARARAELSQRTPKSAAISPEAKDVLALEVVPTFEMPHPIYIESTAGSRVTDVDGNSYIDLTMGFGPHLLGHRPKVIEATMYGMRVARAFTGKDKVAVFDGNYHGAHDYALIKAAPDSQREAPLGKILGRADGLL